MADLRQMSGVSAEKTDDSDMEKTDSSSRMWSLSFATNLQVVRRALRSPGWGVAMPPSLHVCSFVTSLG